MAVQPATKSWSTETSQKQQGYWEEDRNNRLRSALEAIASSSLDQQTFQLLILLQDEVFLSDEFRQKERLFVQKYRKELLALEGGEDMDLVRPDHEDHGDNNQKTGININIDAAGAQQLFEEYQQLFKKVAEERLTGNNAPDHIALSEKQQLLSITQKPSAFLNRARMLLDKSVAFQSEFQVAFSLLEALSRVKNFRQVLQRLARTTEMVQDIVQGKDADQQLEVLRLMAAVQVKVLPEYEKSMKAEIEQRFARYRKLLGAASTTSTASPEWEVLAFTPEIHISVTYDEDTRKSLIRTVMRLQNFNLREALDCFGNLSAERTSWDQKWDKNNQEYLVNRSGKKQEALEELFKPHLTKVLKVGKTCVRGERFALVHLNAFPTWMKWLIGIPETVTVRNIMNPIFQQQQAEIAATTTPPICGMAYAACSWDIEQDEPLPDGAAFKTVKAGCLRKDPYDKNSCYVVDYTETDSLTWVPNWVLAKALEGFGMAHLNEMLNLYRERKSREQIAPGGAGGK